MESDDCRQPEYVQIDSKYRRKINRLWNNLSSKDSKYQKASHKPPSYDDKALFNFLFFNWVKYWVQRIGNEYIGLDDLPQLPKADQISYWYPIFSKHVSDKLIAIENSQNEQVKTQQPIKRFYGVILGATLLTFWKRLIICVMAIFLMNVLDFATAMLLKYLMEQLSADVINYGIITGVIISISVVSFCCSAADQHFTLYNTRLQFLLEYSITIAIFEHGMCFRRNYAKQTEQNGPSHWCDNIEHFKNYNGASCCKHLLSCPASRYQNKELPPSIYTYLLMDGFSGSFLLECIIYVIKFVCTFCFAMILIHYQISMHVFYPIVIMIALIALMICLEFYNGYILKHHLAAKEYRISNTSDILTGLKLLNTMCLEDIACNKIVNCRNDELFLLTKRLFVYFTNVSLKQVTGCLIILVILMDYINKLRINDSVGFEVSGPITLLYIVSKITTSISNLPYTMKKLVEATRSLNRLEAFIQTCSPNYYLATRPDKDLKILKLPQKNTIPKVMVQYVSAHFAWAHSQKELLKLTSDQALFKNLNFTLKQGEICFITGGQGCGKSSFIKSILGEMTLLQGKMLIAPLSSGMPIFYASQEVWFPGGSIRSLILFGHIYNKEIYNKVVKAMELETDFKSWEEGDERIVAEQGYTLSGGQRIRLSLARAIYAYLIFSLENDSLDPSERCCFLMCLDEPFNALDPSVAKSIFYNLFNKTDGILTRGDVSVVCSLSKMVLDVCLKREFVCTNSNCSLFNLVDGILVRVFAYSAGSFKSTNVLEEGATESLTKTNIQMFSSFVKENLSNNSSAFNNIQDCDRLGETEDTSTVDGYKIYLRAVGIWSTISIIGFLLSSTVLENVNKLYIGQWTESINEITKSGSHNLKIVNTDMIKAHHHIAMVYQILSFCIICFTCIGCCIAVYGSVNVSKRIHEFVVNSVFNRRTPSQNVIVSLSEFTTFMGIDLLYIDQYLPINIMGTLFAILKTCALSITLYYTVPILTPIHLGVCVFVYIMVFRLYILASKKLQHIMIECNRLLYSVYSCLISGSPIYRAFKKEWYCNQIHLNYVDYYCRTKFLRLAATVWSQTCAKLTISSILFFLVYLPMLESLLFRTTLKASTIGLSLSLFIECNDSFSYCIYMFTFVEKQICSLRRFKKYFLTDGYNMDTQFDDMNEVVLTYSEENNPVGRVSRTDHTKMNLIIKRRVNEYKFGNIRRYRSKLLSLFYKPNLQFLELSDYIHGNQHNSIELKNVYINKPTTYGISMDTYILSNINCHATASEIIGIVGRTGAGKSTLLDVLQNIHKNRQGSVLLDGKDLNQIPRRVIRHIIGVLPQIPFVFKGWTIRRFLDPRMLYSDMDIKIALENCGLLDFIYSLPGGKQLDTIVKADYKIPHLSSRENVESEDCCLSNSQLRLLYFTRLVLYRFYFRILLVDEPPSDNCFFASIEELSSPMGSLLNAQPCNIGSSIYDLIRLYFNHCTVFIVAHDVNAIRSCNILWIMKDGCISNKLELSDVYKEFDILSLDEIIQKYADINAAE